jgi:hypothetical protein
MELSDGPKRGRESFLALLLATLTGGGFLLFLIMVSGGFFFYVLCAAAAVSGMAFLHYVLWGRSLNQEVAGEREEQAVHERAGPGEGRNGPPGLRRF